MRWSTKTAKKRMNKPGLLVVILATPMFAQVAAIQGDCSNGATQSKTSGLPSSNYLIGDIPGCTVSVYLDGLYSVKSANYQSGGTATGTVGKTCTVTFTGGTVSAVGTVSLSGTNTISAGSPITIGNIPGVYAVAPTSATLSNGTATCSGTASVVSQMTPAKATIYADGNLTPLNNSFTASSNGKWLFFAAINQGYDIVLSGGTPPNVYPSPVTLTGLYPGTNITVNNAFGCTGGSGSINCSGNLAVGTAVTAPSVNSVLDANQFTGADIGTKINAAWASCSYSCEVDVEPGNYSYSTEILRLVPAKESLVGRGAPGSVVLTYTGSVAGIKSQSNVFNGASQSAGRIENIVFITTNASAPAILTGTTVGDNLINVTAGSTVVNDTSGDCIRVENDADSLGYAGWYERNRWTHVIVNPQLGSESLTHVVGCKYGVHLVTNGGTNSFGYNDWDILYNTWPGQTALYLDGSGQPINITAYSQSGANVVLTVASANAIQNNTPANFSVSAGPTYLDGLTLTITAVNTGTNQITVACPSTCTGDGSATGTVALNLQLYNTRLQMRGNQAADSSQTQSNPTVVLETPNTIAFGLTGSIAGEVNGIAGGSGSTGGNHYANGLYIESGSGGFSGCMFQDLDAQYQMANSGPSPLYSGATILAGLNPTINCANNSYIPVGGSIWGANDPLINHGAPQLLSYLSNEGLGQQFLQLGSQGLNAITLPQSCTGNVSYPDCPSLKIEPTGTFYNGTGTVYHYWIQSVSSAIANGEIFGQEIPVSIPSPATWASFLAPSFSFVPSKAGAQPTCTAALISNAGGAYPMWYVVGPPDSLQVCENTTGSTYAWVTLVGGAAPAISAANMTNFPSSLLSTSGGQTIGSANTLTGLPSGCQQYPCTVATSGLLTGRSAAISATTLLASAPAGQYRQCAYLYVISTTETAGTLATQWQLSANLGGGSGSHTLEGNINATLTGDASGVCAAFWVPSGATISYLVPFTSVSGGAINYDVFFTLERLQ